MAFNGRIDQPVIRAAVYLALACPVLWILIRNRWFPLSRGGFGGPWTALRQKFWAESTPGLPSSASRSITWLLMGFAALHTVLDAIY
ncbi:hypothetical protein [Longimicrobium terrae]|uniref:Uncharacterized protein n=1 Tax=Longimicrobium terrae TaxID=1639882 RepID=A0A841H3H6_9BACT|nr:hypothetical protein [Longimicrobium terrae]MBB4638378.1 hypothetical protein [Longimicrobium terrae]MBB6072554.1 hypothetical protein [Longimicrobium terrae]NNC28667.1 hypothetical protein [Longimicrobium terrae]